MELLTQELREQLPPLYSQENEKDPMVICKFFHPLSHWTWYATEFDGTDIFFGWVYGDFPELGYFSLTELEEFTGPLGLGIERDVHFTPMRLSEVKRLHEDTPPRQPMTVVYFTSEEGDQRLEEFDDITRIAQHMASLYLAMNYKRTQWIMTLDERIEEASTAAFARIVEHIAALYTDFQRSDWERVFIHSFLTQVVSQYEAYLVKWHLWQRRHNTEEKQ